MEDSLEVQWAAVVRIHRKLAMFLNKKGRSPMSIYFALRLLVAELEADYGFSMSAEIEEKLREYVKTMELEGF
jgi:hypothetical protein